MRVSKWQKWEYAISVSACFKPTERRIFFWVKQEQTPVNWQLLVHDNFTPPTTQITDSDPANIELYFLYYFYMLRLLFEILITRHTYQMPSILLWVWHFVPIFMFICVFQASCRLQKGSKQKHLFTPLLSRRDLERRKRIEHNGSFKRAMIHTSLQPIGSGLCLLCVSVIDGRERALAVADVVVKLEE